MLTFTKEDLLDSIKLNSDEYLPYEKQELFHNVGKTVRSRLFLAGNRTGKTFWGCREDVFHLTGRYPKWWKGHRFLKAPVMWACSPNYEMSRNVIQKTILQLLPESSIVDTARMSGVKGAYDYISVRHISGGIARVYFKSYKQGWEKFQSERCDAIHLDEEPSIEIYQECFARLADTGDGRGNGIIYITMTPLQGFTELMSKFLQKENGDAIAPLQVNDGNVFIQASWEDNIYLTEDAKKDLENNYSKYELAARRDGIPYRGLGLVYPFDPSAYVVAPFEIPPHWLKLYGLDLGFTAPTAATLIAIDRDSDTMYLYAEYSQTQLTSVQHAANLINLGLLRVQGYCDPSINHTERDGKCAMNDYRDQNFNLETVGYAKNFAVAEISERIRTGRFKIFSNCFATLQEWKTYSRDLKGKIKKGNDHLMNALEFVVIGYDQKILNYPANHYTMRQNSYRSF